MKIKRQICLSNSRDVISPHRLLRVADGGLECTSIEEAKEKFGIVQIGSIPTVTSKNTIDLNVVPSEVIYPTIIGPSTIEKGRSYEYTIRNFDSVSTTYDVSVDEGSVSRVEDVITITAPEESTKEYLTLTINGYRYSLIYYVEGSVSKVVVAGREYYRHSSGMGTVMKWVDKAGTTHNTLVLDAQYRTNLQWYNGSYTDIPTMTNYSNSKYYLSSGTTTDSATSANTYQANTASEFLFHTYTDAIINSLSGYFEDATSSKLETDKIIAALGGDTTHAAGYCRGITVDGVGCDLPNIQTLIRIYCSMFTLDDLDPSTSNNTYKFTMVKSGRSSNWYFGSNGGSGACSSTECDNNYAWTMNQAGYVTNYHKNNTCGALPVLDL